MDWKENKAEYFTRFCKSKVIGRKITKVIIDSVATKWIAAGFGHPKKFLVDNEDNKQQTEQFNVYICATAAYSSWSNGIYERKIDVCVWKIKILKWN